MSVGRPKAFEEREVLERAMDLFWQRGFEAVSLSALVEHMGISRQSLYDTFGNKRALFIRCIEHYRETRLSEALALLERPGSPLENAREVLRFFQRLALDADCRGCLVANALVEMGPHDEQIAEMLAEILGLLQAGIERSLAEAQRRGELPTERSPAALSRALTNAAIGLAVTGKLPLQKETLAEACAGTLSLLE